ncbi:C40 family peptidase [Tumebacillus flagellatus]|uniref:NlpC/P60 domain-containing protein n=1 Tax=Tumebacillus flagellatus TaxID=1157490 RepID=A0A074LNF8_9BACL|nr:NlpC/P60 family protein [Tumebacillus flagellatus]KEO83656.1 hypothetical protein EL26_08330 [Tumebacillus flagellatus]
MKCTKKTLISLLLTLALLFDGGSNAWAATAAVEPEVDSPEQAEAGEFMPGFEKGEVESSDDEAIPAAAHNLHHGQRGPSVRQLQRNLAVLGFFKYPHQTTGYYGWYTKSSVKRFQRAYGVPVTGTYGPATRHALSRALVKHRLVHDSYRYMHIRYKWGGDNPSGFDCSGFVYFMFHKFGVHIPRATANQMFNMGKRVYKSQLQPGDLVFFSLENGHHISHVGFYIGHNKFISATNSRGIYVYSLSNRYWAPHYRGARRVY